MGRLGSVRGSLLFSKGSFHTSVVVFFNAKIGESSASTGLWGLALLPSPAAYWQHQP